MIGKIISHYKILKKLGEGGMGVVYMAEDMKLKRTVALKFLPPELTRDPEAKKRFVHEAQAASALDHPSICTIYEIDETEDNQLFISMASYEGQTLKDKIESGTVEAKSPSPLPIHEAMAIAIQVAKGLDKAHQKGIVHRDIKPANIFVTADGETKILDFGLAKLRGQKKLTKTGTTVGTVAYMSPEQAGGEVVDHCTDVWSLGVVLYEMLTGRLPFKGDYEQAVMYSILNKEPESPRKLREDLPQELEQIVANALRKDKEDRYQSANEILKDLTHFQKKLTSTSTERLYKESFFQRVRHPKIAIPTIFILIILGFVFVKTIHRGVKVRWAREQAIPQIDRLIDEEKYTAAFRLARVAGKYIPSDPMFMELWNHCSWYVSTNSDPEGASVFWKDYEVFDEEWEYLGQTPLDSISIPYGFLRLKLEKEGYGTIYATHYFWSTLRFFKLDKEGTIPDEMVRVTMQGGESSLEFAGYRDLEGIRSGDYFIDMYEVTNKQFKEFVDSGGYEKKEYWKNAFVKEGRILSWEEAMAEFKDRTGRTGPATWEGGDYPDGQDNYPVAGVSWYEAAAYAEFAEKSLPTIYHWNWATDTDWPCAYVISLSNFNDRGPAPVGSHEGLSGFGVYDMAGNVREWCWNERGGKRYILGGGWNDQLYAFNDAYTQSPFDRSPTNGFRCIKHFETEENLTFLQSPIEVTLRDYTKEKPVADEIFEIYRSMYAYDKTKLNAAIESIDTSAEDWNVQKISFDAAYGDERVFAYLFLPRTGNPPYQTVVYFPSGMARDSRSFQSTRIKNIDYIIKSGRALMFPIFKGTYERGGGLPLKKGKTFYKERVIQYAKDLGRSIDYLETRADIDTSKLAYYGLSWGGVLGVIMCVVESRFKASVLNVAGLSMSEKLPEVDEINFVSRINIPLLMLNGKYDHYYPYETNQVPMFELVGTNSEHKRQVIYETGHIVPRALLIREVLDWLDRFLGPVK